jgi:hypothetical protein
MQPNGQHTHDDGGIEVWYTGKDGKEYSFVIPPDIEDKTSSVEARLASLEAAP